MIAIPTEKFEGARAELDLLVGEWLTEYLSKTVGVDTPPRWTWTSGWTSPYYRRTEKAIYISEIYLKAYILSPSKAKRALRWSLAHEYWHYVQEVRGGPFALPILDFPRMAEYLADKHAVLLSGISDAEGQSLTVDVVDLVMYYERESPSREFKVRYIDQTTGQTVETTISEAEQFDLYEQQREGKISIIEITTVGKEVNV